MSDSDREIERYFIESIPLFNAMGDRNRQLILMYLKSHEGTSVNELARQMPISRPAVSHHLKILLDAGLLRSERHGTSLHYFIDIRSSFGPLRELIKAIDRT